MTFTQFFFCVIDNILLGNKRRRYCATYTTNNKAVIKSLYNSENGWGYSMYL
jgi:hypothetical protein